MGIENDIVHGGKKRENSIQTRKRSLWDFLKKKKISDLSNDKIGGRTRREIQIFDQIWPRQCQHPGDVNECLCKIK